LIEIETNNYDQTMIESYSQKLYKKNFIGIKNISFTCFFFYMFL